MKKSSHTVIEISDSHVKCVQSKGGRSQLSLASADVKSVKGVASEDFSKIINDITATRNIAAEEIAVVIPRRQCILKKLRLPSTNLNEIKKMIGLQLVNQIPYGLDDIVYEYQLLEKEEAGYVQVLVAIVHRDICQKLLNHFGSIGIPLSKMTISSFGLLEWAIYQRNAKNLKIVQPSILVSIDTEHSEICFINDDKLYFSRHINFGGRDLNEDNMVGLINQIELSLATYQKEALGPDPKKMFILSDSAEAQLLKEKLEKELTIATDVVSPMENITSSKDVNLNGIKQEGVSLSVSAGILAMDPRRLLNVTPQEVHQTKETKRVRGELVKFAIFAFICIGLGLSTFYFQVDQKEKELVNIEEKVKLAKIKVKEANERIDFVRFFESVSGHRVFVPDIVRELIRITPSEISYRSLLLDESGRFTVQGYAQTRASVNNFQGNMVKSTIFKDVNLQFATKRKIFNTDVTDFKLIAEIFEKEQR